MKQSGVSLMDKDKGKAATEWRTSSTYFLRTGSDEVLRTVDRRVESLTMIEKSHQEQVRDSLPMCFIFHRDSANSLTLGRS